MPIYADEYKNTFNYQYRLKNNICFNLSAGAIR